MKHKSLREFGSFDEVAPFTGAWIETSAVAGRWSVWDVAPFTGAWIETRELNPKLWMANVAPFTGAWIETARR